MHGSPLIGSAVAAGVPTTPRASWFSSLRRVHKPKLALCVLCLVVMLERLGYGLLGSTFVLYLVERRGMRIGDALSSMGWFTGLTYFAAVFGGLFADRRDAHLRCALLGLGLLAVGYLAVATQPVPAWLSIGILIGGQGLFKSNVATLVGRVPTLPGDSAYTSFYLAINAGVVVAPFLAEWIRSRVGYYAVFAIAGSISSLGLLVLWSLRHLIADGRPLIERVCSSSKTAEPAAQRAQPGTQHKALLGLFSVLVCFCGAFQLTEGAILFFARDHIDRSIVNFIVPTVWLYALPSLATLLVAPLLSRIWGLLRNRGIELASGAKIQFGLVATALSFALLSAAGRFGGDEGRVGLAWLVGGNLILAVGELCVAPIAMSVISKLAPPRWAGMLMGVSFAAAALGSILAGQVGMLWERTVPSVFFGMVAVGIVAVAGCTWLRRS